MSHRDRYLDCGGLGSIIETGSKTMGDWGLSYRQVLRLWWTGGLIETGI